MYFKKEGREAPRKAQHDSGFSKEPRVTIHGVPDRGLPKLNLSAFLRKNANTFENVGYDCLAISDLKLCWLLQKSHKRTTTPKHKHPPTAPSPSRGQSIGV